MKSKYLKSLKTFGNFNELNDYINSEENINACKPFELLNQKFDRLKGQYEKSFEELSDAAQKNECRKEYSKGGEVMHRGFYSPSFTDLVVGGCHRGKLLKRPSQSKSYSYEYLFDKNSRLICCKKYDKSANDDLHLIGTEFLVYENDVVLGLGFSHRKDIYDLNYISECKYENNLLLNYEFALLNYNESGCTNIEVQEFEYANNSLKTVYWSRYNPDIKTLNKQRYMFLEDEVGILSRYVVEDIHSFIKNGPRELTVQKS